MQSGCRWIWLRRITRASAIIMWLMLGPGLLLAGESSSSDPSYNVFIGLDLAVPHRGEHRRIEEFGKGVAYVSDEKGAHGFKLTELRAMRFFREPRISETMVIMENLKVERTLSVNANDELQAMHALADFQEQGGIERGAAEARLTSTLARHSPDSPEVRAAQAQVMETQRVWEDRDLAMLSHHARTGNDQPGGGFDSLDIRFRVSAPAPIADAYAAVHVLMELPEQPGRTHQTVRLRRLGKIGPKPKNVRFVSAGFPPGFTLKQSTVHIYAGTEEFATNLSESNVRVSRDEAHQFLVLQYQLKHANQTLAPVPVRQLILREWRTQLAASELARMVTLAVDATGVPVGFFAGNNRTEELTGSLRDVLEQVRFYPALQAGQPAESSFTGTLDELL